MLLVKPVGPALISTRGSGDAGGKEHAGRQLAPSRRSRLQQSAKIEAQRLKANPVALIIEGASDVP